MNDVEALIDRALSQSPEIEPSPFFAARVMSAIRGEATLPPLPFPLWRFSTALLLLLFVVVGTLALP